MRVRIPHKYEPMLEYLLASDAKVAFASSFVRRPCFRGFVQYLSDQVELVVWCVLNGISLRRVSLVRSASELNSRDTLFLLHYENFTHEDEEVARSGRELADILRGVPATIVLHFTHYAYHPAIGASNVGVLQPKYIVAENNLAKNSEFFRRYFSAVAAQSRCLPYIAGARFVRREQFSARRNKLVATGSMTFKMRSREFTEFFGTDELQPMRRELFVAAERYSTEMDCLISDLDATRRAPQLGRMAKLVRRIKAIAKGGAHPQAGYYGRDIVATYNAYTMFAVPEEICGLPAIGFVEGMACGCAYFGCDDPMYRDIGMVPGIHYIAHDGTVEGLMDKVRHYQQPGSALELERIAQAGFDFVTQTLTADRVYSWLLPENIALSNI